MLSSGYSCRSDQFFHQCFQRVFVSVRAPRVKRCPGLVAAGSGAHLLLSKLRSCALFLAIRCTLTISMAFSLCGKTGFTRAEMTLLEASGSFASSIMTLPQKLVQEDPASRMPRLNVNQLKQMFLGPVFKNIIVV
jgi:hypothetical protein